jgi:signal transduction histidine kinase
VCEQMRPLAAARSQQLSCRAPRELPTIQADPSRLQQVLSNVIGNAIKFTPEGGAIAVQAIVAQGDVRFSVRDSGPGISAEDLPRLFDRHWRARRTAHLGAGLGLAIARGIVEAHGGRIWAESDAGRGATFHFVLPLQAEIRQSPEQPDAGDGESPGAAVEAGSNGTR